MLFHVLPMELNRTYKVIPVPEGFHSSYNKLFGTGIVKSLDIFSIIRPKRHTSIFALCVYSQLAFNSFGR